MVRKVRTISKLQFGMNRNVVNIYTKDSKLATTYTFPTEKRKPRFFKISNQLRRIK